MTTNIVTGFQVEIPNTPGALQQTIAALAGADVNVTGIQALGVGQEGYATFTVGDPQAAASALDGAGIPYQETPLLTADLPHTPGSLEGALQTLAENGVNLESLLVQASPGTNEASLAFGVANPQKVSELLG